MFNDRTGHHMIMAQNLHLKTNVVVPMRQYLVCDACFSGLVYKIVYTENFKQEDSIHFTKPGTP